MSLHEFLNFFDFEYVLLPTQQFKLLDLTGANLANIEDEVFPCTESGLISLVVRLNVYIDDYIVHPFESHLQGLGVDTTYLDLEELVSRRLEKSIGLDDYRQIAQCIIEPQSLEFA